MATVVTKTIKPGGGGDYTTLAACITARARDLVAADEQEDWVCYSGNLGVYTLFTGYVTDDARYIRIVADPSSRHSGAYDTTKTHIYTNANDCFVSTNDSLKVVIDGIAFRTNATSYANYCVRLSGSSTAKSKVIGCVFYVPSGATGFKAPNSTSYVQVVNCIAYGTGTGFRGGEIVNCTAYGLATGFYRDYYTDTVKNCLAQGCANGFNGTFSASSDYNCSDISEDAPGAHSVTGTVQVKDSANKDFHLAAADTVARGAGVNLTASGITTDIDGETRPATGAWDIGADHYVPLSEDKFGYCIISAQAFAVVRGSKSSGLSASATAVAQATVRGTKQGQGRAAANAVSAARASGSKAGAGYAIAQAIAQAVVRGEKSVLTNIVVEIIGVMPGAAALLARRSSAKAIAAQHQPPVSISARMRKPG